MQGYPLHQDGNWELVYSQFLQDNNNPLTRVYVPVEFSYPFVKVRAEATDIPTNWRFAGHLYQRVSSPINSSSVYLGRPELVMLNTTHICTVVDTPAFYVEYLPFRRFLEQSISIWRYVIPVDEQSI